MTDGLAQRPRRLLLSRPDRLGDVVISSCLLPVLKGALPDTELWLLIREPYAPLFTASTILDGLLPLDSREGLETILRQHDFDAVVHLNPEPVLEQAARLAGIPLRVGFGRKGNRNLTHSVPDRRKQTGRHEARAAFTLLAQWGVNEPTRLEPALAPAPEAHATLVEKLPPLWRERPLALLHLAAHGNKPRLPLEWFAAAARHLHQEHQLGIILVGAEAETKSFVPFIQASGLHVDNVLDLRGQTTVPELAWLCARAQVMFGRDSGPAHLAAGMACPTVTVFPEWGPIHGVERWEPLGPSSFALSEKFFTWPWQGRHAMAELFFRRFPSSIISGVLDGAVAAHREDP